ncbi:glycosyltransferase family 2 protein [Flavimaricola marinus]|uniref:N-acetylglucosaminyl-diphospho-decaprenol L-rhamnosyltransferase n=1 Tax=Flavimaricola marinus TaxID=1819565 RepID=A0A238LD65_9RHOB|nr:glycosyltransferase family 2 protein [Flavimaricola marinus]SMY06886.1 N-acetylglucosaminyl-diphospho-decaprenol L-rhamnosyltransferase [Flavimaricola marinus]
MTKKPRLLTIVLNWRTAEMTLRSVEAVRAAMSRLDGEIIVVDNDSQDGSFEAISAHVAKAGWDDVRVIQSGHNGGFGAGNNVGIRAGLSDGSRPDLVYVLNSDAFPAPDAVEVLEMYLRAHPQAGFAGSLIHGPRKDVHLTTFRFPSIASEFEGAVRFGPISRLLKSKAVPLPTPEHAGRVDWLAGASMMMRMDVLDKIGLFDETFFLYFEETDLCRRAAKAGFEVHFVPQSRVEHIGSVSTGMKTWGRVPAYWFESRQYYFRKNHGRFYAHCATFAHVLGGALHRLRAKLSGKPPTDPPHFLRDLISHELRSLRRPDPESSKARALEGAS